MKKVLIAAAFLASFSFAFAQDKMQDNDLKTWYHKDFSTTNVYGVNTDNAYKFLESKGLKPRTIVVGVLDSGVEVDHPGLINNMWKNPNEIPNNGIDDDKNGYVDDIYGWNFIGGKTADVDADNLEVTRMVKKYQPILEGTDSAKNRANQAKMPEEYAIYQKSKKLYDEKGSEAKQYYHYFSGFNNAIPSIVKTLNGKTLTKANLAAIKPASQEDSRNLQILNSLVQDAGNVGKTPKEVEELLRKEIEGALKHYESQATKHYNLDFDPRAEIVGDNYDNYNEKHYGNNHYEGPDASHGTHVSGIIAGLPHGNEAQYGVAHKVAKIMTVRAVPDGDERDKDVANAIRYAVDNGAKILNMSFGKAVSPGKKHVWDAMKYAEKKGVLLVKAAGNENQNIGENEYFPTNFMKQSDEKPFVSNMIVVGASTNNSQNLRARFSNYNGKMVDVFAPGQEIYSTVPDAKYEYLQGTSMASPVVAGAAAVLWAYMPSLTPQQIKEALVKTVNKSTVNANVDSNANFDQISVAGGVIDLYKAAQYAYDNFYNKKG
ncbi:MAG: S8 family serine peptidase, partial [Flavobacteriaceae bacterium]|nr:S8 family serine peptidase [Flavobacteriaceae bacterium]